MIYSLLIIFSGNYLPLEEENPPPDSGSISNKPNLNPPRTLEGDEAPSDERGHEGWTPKELTDLVKNYNMQRGFSKKVLRLLKARRLHHPFNMNGIAGLSNHVAPGKGKR